MCAHTSQNLRLNRIVIYHHRPKGSQRLHVHAIHASTGLFSVLQFAVHTQSGVMVTRTLEHEVVQAKPRVAGHLLILGSVISPGAGPNLRRLSSHCSLGLCRRNGDPSIPKGNQDTPQDIPIPTYKPEPKSPDLISLPRSTAPSPAITTPSITS